MDHHFESLGDATSLHNRTPTFYVWVQFESAGVFTFECLSSLLSDTGTCFFLKHLVTLYLKRFT